ncbi:Retrovirus-related Pol polyprotein from transposon TNT 1-94 [Vitis vinifera]|uniref:Retrovirus-related Pol polyprotein from transposon TNT 1-94 n=1 Tax=Vitis vinifera TaxID=29760 RepID=A0A438HP80_VITVI|nr:Retrovirus-related Pol polyprotein from transposon TNT 1-94 [Vitis vinifera]
MKKKYQGSTRTKRQQLQALRSEFETLRMKPGESVSDYFSRTMAIINKMRIHGEKMEDVTVIEKILRSMTPKFNYVVCSIEEWKDLDELSIDELQGSLLVHEQKIIQEDKEEQALKASTNNNALTMNRSTDRGRGKGRGVRGVRDGEKKEVETLLMAAQVNEQPQAEVWYVDTSCSNHMCGNLKSNLLSAGQLQEKGYIITIQKGACEIYDPSRGAIVVVQMASNKLFPLKIDSVQSFLMAEVKDLSWLWHLRYGHLNFGGLKTLQQKHMVTGLPQISIPSQVCEECVVGKQHRSQFPQGKSRRAKNVLELEKSEAFSAFKSFKARVEKETGRSIKILRTDRGGEYCSNEVEHFCDDQGIRRELTAAYTPQQNGVSEKKNRTILNMVRSLLARGKIPKSFWPEVVNWSIHVLNRSPTFSVQNMTPEKAWSGWKPAVDHFKIFCCIAYAHITDEKRNKLDDKGEKCVFLGVSEASKAYKLFNPLTKKIVTSRDVIFDEESTWNWNGQQPTQVIFDNDVEEERQQLLQQQIPTVSIPESPPNDAPTTAETSSTAAESNVVAES